MPTVSELKERARAFEQKGELATALKVYRHILSHLEGTPALAAEIPLYVKVGDLSAKLGTAADAVEMYRKAGTHYAAAGSARTLIALALKVMRVDPAGGDVYAQFAQDLLGRGHDGAAAEVLGAAADRGGLSRLRAALAWAAERSDEDARGVLVRLAEALGQGSEAAEREAEAITAPPAPAGPPADEPLQLERISEAEPPAEMPVVWSADEPEYTETTEPPSAAPASDDLGLATDRWREALEQVAPPSPRASVPPPAPPAEPAPSPEPPPAATPPALEFEPLVSAPSSRPSFQPEPEVERASARRSAPSFGRVIGQASKKRHRGRIWMIAAAVVVVGLGAAVAVAFDLVPRGGGNTGVTPPAPDPADSGRSGPPPADPPPGDPVTTAPADTVVPPAPAVVAHDTLPPADSIFSQADTGTPPDTSAVPPILVPVVEAPPVAPPPVARLDTTTAGPPTVRVPAGTSLRDMLIVVPGMPVESVVAVPLAGRRGHRVVQRLPDGEPLVLTSAPMTGSDTVGISHARITVAGDTTVGSVRFWSFLVTARARADADTLARLLRRLVRARPVR